MDQVFCETGNN